MNGEQDVHHDQLRELLHLHALRVLPADEAAIVQAHTASCGECSRHLAVLRDVVGDFVAWDTDVLRPPASLWERLVSRIGPSADGSPPPLPDLPEPRWSSPAPGVEVKVLAEDRERNELTLLVRLAPGAEYPPHRHGGREELWMLHGELRVDDRRYGPGEYGRAEPGTVDRRVWTETGCSCVLVTSGNDELM